VKSLAVALIRSYQKFVSPFLPATCIYSPSCSAYALEAYGRHGFWRGTWMTCRRLARCWPWCAGGFDPVP
jgi:putative membrane protein insertion efficiency factor